MNVWTATPYFRPAMAGSNTVPATIYAGINYTRLGNEQTTSNYFQPTIDLNNGYGWSGPAVIPRSAVTGINHWQPTLPQLDTGHERARKIRRLVGGNL